MKTMLVITGILESATGVVLLLAPAQAGLLLFDAELTGAAIAITRFAGIALLALGIGCWPGPAFAGMLTYNVLATLFFAYTAWAGGLTGILLWPAAILHAILSGLLIYHLPKLRRAE